MIWERHPLIEWAADPDHEKLRDAVLTMERQAECRTTAAVPKTAEPGRALWVRAPLSPLRMRYPTEMEPL
jgi:hypothetical protein